MRRAGAVWRRGAVCGYLGAAHGNQGARRCPSYLPYGELDVVHPTHHMASWTLYVLLTIWRVAYDERRAAYGERHTATGIRRAAYNEKQAVYGEQQAAYDEQRVTYGKQHTESSEWRVGRCPSYSPYVELDKGNVVLIFQRFLLGTFLKLFRERSLRVAILGVDFEIIVFDPNNGLIRKMNNTDPNPDFSHSSVENSKKKQFLPKKNSKNKDKFAK